VYLDYILHCTCHWSTRAIKPASEAPEQSSSIFALVPRTMHVRTTPDNSNPLAHSRGVGMYICMGPSDQVFNYMMATLWLRTRDTPSPQRLGLIGSRRSYPTLASGLVQKVSKSCRELLRWHPVHRHVERPTCVSEPHAIAE